MWVCICVVCVVWLVWKCTVYMSYEFLSAYLMMERLSEDEIEATAASDDVETEREGQRTKKGRWMVQLSIELSLTQNGSRSGLAFNHDPRHHMVESATGECHFHHRAQHQNNNSTALWNLFLGLHRYIQQLILHK